MSEFKLTPQAERLLDARYYLPGEDWDRFCIRVSSFLANNEEENNRYYNIQHGGIMLLNTPALMNAGTDHPMMSACFVMVIEDDMDNIMGTLHKAMKIFKGGGGVGFNFNNLRPEGSRVMSTAKGVSSGPVSFLQMYDTAVQVVKQGAKRRGAALAFMSINHPDIVKFIKCKSVDKKIGNFNLSIGMTDKFMERIQTSTQLLEPHLCEFNNQPYFILKKDDTPILVEEYHKMTDGPEVYSYLDVWNLICHQAWSNGEPGLLYWDEIKRNDNVVECVNPCITGDTLVYVADGRGMVSIKELAKEEKDIPVFCVNNKEQMTIRTMREPRLTGTKTPVYKVTCDDGTSFKATGNHTMYLTGNKQKRVDELVTGDSLRLISSSVSNKGYKDIYFAGNVEREHQLIAKFSQNIENLDNLVVHHKDYNKPNNTPSNLQIMTKEEHDKLHAKDMLGDKNPMRRAKHKWSKEKWDKYSKSMSKATSKDKNGRYLGITNDELLEYAVELTKNLGHRFSKREWEAYARANDLPIGFSKWRNDHFCGIIGLAKQAALRCGFDNLNADPRLVRRYNKYIGQGYNCEIIDNQLWFIKSCEYCGKEFKNPRSTTAYCSGKCGSRNMTEADKQRAVENRAVTIQEKKKQNGIRMVEVFLDMKSEFGHEPMSKQFHTKCKDLGIPHRFGPSSYFGTYKELKDFASGYNHRVQSVEFAGYEDVYNGTVDEFHNFCIGGWESKTTSGNSVSYCFNSGNCGELPLPHASSCNLGSVDVSKFIDDDGVIMYSELDDAVRTSVDMLNAVIDKSSFPLPEIEEKTKEERRIGLGIMGFAEMLIKMKIKYGSDDSLQVAGNIMSNIKIVAEKHSEAMGYNNKTMLAIAPTGSRSLIAECSGGIEPVIEWVTVHKREGFPDEIVKHPLAAEYLDAGEDLPDYFVTADQIAPKDHIRLQAAFQEYVDSGISKTVNLPNSAPVKDVEEVYKLAWELKCKGVTVYRDGSRQDQVISKFDKDNNDNKNEENNNVNSCSCICDTCFPKERPYVLEGFTFKVPLDMGDKVENVYISVGTVEGQPYEIFVNGNVRGASAQTAEEIDATTRLVSLALREGASVDRVIEQLGKVPCRHMFAVPKKIVQVLKEFLPPDKHDPCPECGGQRVFTEGCEKCLQCGWGACG